MKGKYSVYHKRKISSDDLKRECALCHHMVIAYRYIRKIGKHLSIGYFQPRLTEQELFELPQGESTICQNRTQCRQNRRM